MLWASHLLIAFYVSPLDLVAAPYRFPALWQTLAIAFCSACAFMSFFVTLTFLLNDYYGFSELQIGLFNLIGLVGIGLARECYRIALELRSYSAQC